ncbi:MAG: T9SS type A sorting domain-containing protein [Ignavibacteriaceae bacterium]
MSQKNTLYIILLIILFNVSSFAQWKSVGLNDQYVWTFAVIDSNIFAGSGGGGIFLSTDNGATWEHSDSGLTSLGISSLIGLPNPVGGNYIFAGTYGDGVFLSTNNGATWAQTSLDSQYVWSLASSGSNIFAGTEKGIFLSSNNGTNWTQINSGLTNFVINALVVSPNGTNIFAGTAKGIFLSKDNGTNWVSIDSGLTNQYVWSLFISDTNLFAGTEKGVFLSTNNGANWKQLGLDTQYVWTFAKVDSMLFVGTNGGVFASTNNTFNWIPINSGLSNSDVTSLVIKDTNIFAGSFGVYVLSLNNIFTPTVVKQIKNSYPQEFFLAQNYPNPFNPSTTINFAVQKESFVSIKVYDALGREIATLVNEEKPVGNYSVQLVLGNKQLASGVYFYRMQAGSFVETKKLIFMK